MAPSIKFLRINFFHIIFSDNIKNLIESFYVLVEIFILCRNFSVVVQSQQNENSQAKRTKNRDFLDVVCIAALTMKI